MSHRMMTTTIHFEPVRLRQSVGYKCTSCGKPLTRVVCVEYTVNPFNKNADGVPKTREEVRADVRKKHAKQVAETKAGFMCNKCKDAIVAARDAERCAQRAKDSGTE